LNIRITFAVDGRARFLAHLESVDTLLSALRRAGYPVALSAGPKPRPVVALAVPRAVGVESLAEIAEVQLACEPDLDELAPRLDAELPDGMTVLAAVVRDGRPAAGRVDAIGYRVSVGDDVDWARAACLMRDAPSAPVVRRSPKGEKRVDVARFLRDVRVGDGELELELALTPEGTARPEEAVAAIAAQVGAEATPRRIVRTAIVLREDKVEVPA
jgi:radical SAM-linked protein